MTTYLADGNLLIALTVVEHIHHQSALTWFDIDQPGLATCPITQGTLIRFLIRNGHSAADAMEVLEALTSQTWHRFIPDSLAYNRDHLRGVIGHRQVTDAYLTALARHNNLRVATLDKGMAALHPDTTHLIDTTQT